MGNATLLPLNLSIPRTQPHLAAATTSTCKVKTLPVTNSSLDLEWFALMSKKRAKAHRKIKKAAIVDIQRLSSRKKWLLSNRESSQLTRKSSSVGLRRPQQLQTSLQVQTKCPLLAKKCRRSKSRKTFSLTLHLTSQLPR